ncbi:MAG: alpha/beta hydrolase [Intrasporangiaceae bacterium]|nr:alpha/beta hydrolase [Intrasporangiaceae bacterium]
MDFIHGGGTVLGTVDGENANAARICDEVGAVVVSVAYHEHHRVVARDHRHRHLGPLPQHRGLGTSARWTFSATRTSFSRCRPCASLRGLVRHGAPVGNGSRTNGRSASSG